MTKNQIEYAKLLETSRANKANEELTKRRDDRAYEVNLGQLDESRRHNVATEAQARASLDETIRANQAREAHEVNVLAETKRSNQAREAETQRSNLAREAETHRSNVAQEVELNRSHLANEAETRRSNLAREAETSRSNRANESIARENVDISRMSLAERVRAAQAAEKQNRAALDETIRHNYESEANDRTRNYVNAAKYGVTGAVYLGAAAAENAARSYIGNSVKQGNSKTSTTVGHNAKATSAYSKPVPRPQPVGTGHQGAGRSSTATITNRSNTPNRSKVQSNPSYTTRNGVVVSMY